MLTVRANEHGDSNINVALMKLKALTIISYFNMSILSHSAADVTQAVNGFILISVKTSVIQPVC